MSQSAQAPTLPEKQLEYIQVTQAAMTKAAAAEKKAAAKAAEISALIPKVVEVMVAHERCRPDQKEKLAADLTDPAAVLRILTATAGHRNAQELAVLGRGEGQQTKTAQHDPNGSLRSAYVGERTHAVKASDIALFRGLGLPDPQGPR